MELSLSTRMGAPHILTTDGATTISQKSVISVIFLWQPFERSVAPWHVVKREVTQTVPTCLFATYDTYRCF